MAHRLTRGLLSTALLITTITAVPIISRAPRAAHAASTPTTIPFGLPTHLGIGLAALPDSSGIYGWMPDSHIPWDYAYQYLSGGANTGHGWETWNTSGQFALYYAQGAASHNYIPVFSYYEMLQSNGSCGSCGEAQKDLSNLNNTSTMASYFQNFALLMKRLGSGTYDGIAGFGKTAIVHVEPDLSGFAEQSVLDNSKCYGYCAGQGNNPALLQAAVNSSGVSDVVGYPNTYQGFNQALLHLRDRYAPNVRLAFHVSTWATINDIGSSTDSTLDATALGQEAGSFAAQNGAYDLIFNDVGDRDAGYYKYVYNNPHAWWDKLNVTFPNFHRWETYIGAVHSAAGKPIMIWQIPEGNQYFDTENNTNGHYQDNRAEYFFGHMDELAQAGVIGLLFGAGNGGSTVNADGMNDDVTNPASLCTSDGVSSGQVCNTNTSTVSDDDGGYLRMMGQQYYANGGYPLTGSSPATATSTPAPPTATDVPATTTLPALPSPAPSATMTATPSATMTATPSATMTAAPSATMTAAPSATMTAAPSATTAPASLAVTINSVAASPATAPQGGTTSFVATVTTNAALANAIVDVELYDGTGARVYQTYQDNVSFIAGAPRTITVPWTVPAVLPAGTFTLKVGVFGAGWAPLYAWNDAAATLAVIAATTATSVPPTNTPVPPTNTPVPPTNTPVPPTNTPVPPTNMPTSTPVPPTNTPVPPTNTPVPPTNTPVPPTVTATNTPAPPTSTLTNTPVPPIATSTPPTLPVNTPAAPPALAITFGRTTMSAASAVPGKTATFTTTIMANRAVANELVDFEVYNSAGARVWQTWKSPVAFSGATPQTFTASWPVPATQAAGAYTLKLGVFTSGWSFHAWNDHALTITVVASMPTTYTSRLR